jgi:ABC-type sugar transport system permease subunit
MAADFRLDNLQWGLATVVFIAFTSLLLGYTAQFVARLRGLTAAEQRKTFWGFSFAGPWIIGFIIFVVGPAIASLLYSFTDYKIGKTMSEINWVGLDNYRKMLLVEGATGRQFNKAMINSFYYALIGVPMQIMASLFMALLLNNELPFIKVFRMIFYLPVILAGGPALLLAWRYMLSANGGFINEALQAFADSFVGFDYLYRGFIYVMEGFNVFYTGITRADPIGPLKYTVPAFIGALVLVTMVGEWNDGKRIRAWRAAQLVGLVVVYRLMYQGFMQSPVDAAWTLFYGITLAAGMGVAAWYGNHKAVKVW